MNFENGQIDSFDLQSVAYEHAPLWGLVLAAGEGKRLERFIRETRGEALPKQFVNVVGQGSMLEQTLSRAAQLIPEERILTIVGRHHWQHGEVRRQLARRASENVIVQPDNKETGPGIFLPLTYLYKRAPEAIVSVFPSDHFILEEERFMDHVDLAVRAIHHDPSRIALLGMEANTAEVEYGYIMPRSDSGEFNLWGTLPTAGFVEKPHPAIARKLVQAGGLWNTMIMVFKVRAVFGLLRKLYPDAYRLFGFIFNAIDTPMETATVQEVYRQLEPFNFSRDFLEKIAEQSPDTIAVLPVLRVFWSDLGSPQRLVQVRKLMAQRAARSAELRRDPAPAPNLARTAARRPPDLQPTRIKELNH